MTSAFTLSSLDQWLFQGQGNVSLLCGKMVPELPFLQTAHLAQVLDVLVCTTVWQVARHLLALSCSHEGRLCQTSLNAGDGGTSHNAELHFSASIPG